MVAAANHEGSIPDQGGPVEEYNPLGAVGKAYLESAYLTWARETASYLELLERVRLDRKAVAYQEMEVGKGERKAEN